MAQPDEYVEGIPKPGDEIAGKYRVERLLGAGGMGAVVAATHLGLGQQVAVKFLLAEAALNPNSISRFEREARAAAKIQSDHVAKVHDVGKLDSGTPYMVMEFLEGEDLSAALERGRLPVQLAIRCVLEASEALAEAHKLGIVHRDMKPANLFLARRADGSTRIKVLDFGISKDTGGLGAQLTRTSALMGSPVYMAPEQMESAKYVDARSDIWALGTILYEAITGLLPFGGDTLPEICAKILQAEPPPLGSVLPGAPPGLQAAITRALQKRPDARFQNLAEFTAALVPFGDADAPRSVAVIHRVLGIALPANVPAGTGSVDLPTGALSGRAAAAGGPGGPATTAGPGGPATTAGPLGPATTAGPLGPATTAGPLGPATTAGPWGPATTAGPLGPATTAGGAVGTATAAAHGGVGPFAGGLPGALGAHGIGQGATWPGGQGPTPPTLANPAFVTAPGTPGVAAYGSPGAGVGTSTAAPLSQTMGGRTRGSRTGIVAAVVVAGLLVSSGVTVAIVMSGGGESASVAAPSEQDDAAAPATTAEAAGATGDDTAEAASGQSAGQGSAEVEPPPTASPAATTMVPSPATGTTSPAKPATKSPATKTATAPTPPKPTGAPVPTRKGANLFDE